MSAESLLTEQGQGHDETWGTDTDTDSNCMYLIRQLYLYMILYIQSILFDGCSCYKQYVCLLFFGSTIYPTYTKTPKRYRFSSISNALE